MSIVANQAGTPIARRFAKNIAARLSDVFI
jgi:hypothetical protein